MSTTQALSATEAPGANGHGVANEERCQRLLGRALEVLGGGSGAIFCFDGDSRSDSVPLYLQGADLNATVFAGAAMEARRSRRVLLASMPADLTGSSAASASRFLALPLEVDAEIVGALVVTGLAGHLALDMQLARLGELPEALGLALERARVLQALDKRGTELSSLRRQLDAFAIDFRSTYQAERDRSQQLSDALAELERTYRATVSGLAMAVEAKDECTGGHLYRVSRYGMLVTEVVAPEHAKDPQFEYGFLLHDVGKLMVPDDVLNKPGALTDAEWALMKEHPANGRSILDGIEFLDGAREIVYCHHERWDGNGYPRGLRGMEIPLGARIFPLCDAFDAMTSDRPYRRALPMDEAMDQVRKGAGTQFWAEAVDAFLSVPRDELEVIMQERRCRPS